jgi:hypothetical protein
MLFFVLQHFGIPHDPRARMAVLVCKGWSLGWIFAWRINWIRGRERASSQERDGAMATVVSKKFFDTHG